MMNFANAFVTELIKLRRTLALLMVLVGPLIVVGLFAAIVLRRAEPLAAGTSLWQAMVPSSYMMWAFGMLPLLIALQTTLTGHIEYAGSNWKHLFALPVPRWSICAAKLTVNLLLSALSHLMLVVWVGVFALVIALIRPDLGAAFTLPPPEALGAALGSFAASSLVVVIHSWVSMRWQNVVLGLGLGVGATVVSMVLMNSQYWRFFPWTITPAVTFALCSPLRAEPVGGMTDIPTAMSLIALMIALAMLAAVAAIRDLSRREVL